MIAVGIDPGKRGYACMVREGSRDGGPPRVTFWAAPVASEDGEKPDYARDAMVAIVSSWREAGAGLVVVEEQAPRRHGGGRGQREGTVSSWTNGYGYGLWLGCLAAGGFEGGMVREVDPAAWKRSMGALAVHRGEDSDYARRRTNDARTLEVARVVDPGVDYRPLERSPRATTPSPDKAVSRLLAEYSMSILKGEIK